MRLAGGRPQGFGVQQADEEGLAVLALAVVKQFINKALAPAAPMGQDVFHLQEPVQMHAHLEVGPAGMLAHVAAREPVVGPDQL